MRVLTASALLASFVIATPAFAQDGPAADGKEFQGVKVLAVAGVDHVSSRWTGDPTGISYGGTIGYDYQAGKVVFGVEGEVDGATTKNCADNYETAGDHVCFKAGRDLYAGVRAGVVVGNKALLYVKGGYDNGRRSSTYTFNNTTIKSGDNLDGVRVGTGVEVNAGKNLVVRTEYRYTNYTGSISRHQGVVGVGFKF